MAMHHPEGSRRRLCFAVALTLMLAGRAQGQTGNGLELRWSTIDGGGISAAGSAGFQLGATIGQPDAGTLTAPGWVFNGGFWGGAPVEVTSTPTATPSVTATSTATRSATPTPAPMDTGTATHTPTSTRPATDTETATATATQTQTRTVTTPTPTATIFASPTPTPTPSPTPHDGATVGDCDGGGSVTINELITMVSIALGSSPLSMCPNADADASGNVTIAELIAAVNAALQS
jgi:hypothetical protein